MAFQALTALAAVFGVAGAVALARPGPLAGAVAGVAFVGAGVAFVGAFVVAASG